MPPSNEFPGNIFYYLLFFGFLAFFAWSAWVRFRWLTRAQSINRLTAPVKRALGLIPWLLGNARVARPKYWYSGMLHTMIWWGFVVLQVRTLNFLLNGFDDGIGLDNMFGVLYDGFRPVLDLFNILVIVGTIMAAYQRFFWRPKRMTLNADGWIILGLIAWLMVTDIFTTSFEIYLFDEERQSWSFLAYGVSQIWDGMGMTTGTADAFHVFWWYSHLVDFLVFLCYLPYSKHSHVLTIAPQVFFRNLEAPTGGILQPIPDFEKAESFGVGKLEEFTWKQLLDGYTCTECGRCTAACPANLTGKILSPKQVIVDIRHLMEEQEPALAPWTERPDAPTPLIDGVGFEPIWDCVTCGACMYECPVFIEHVPTIMDMRRHLVMEKAEMPETAQATLMQIEQRGHPWRGTQLTRTTWIEEMKAEGVTAPMFDGSQEYLYWVGCTGALQERNVKVTKAIVRLLQQAGVSFGVLGSEEGCSGDPARRFGNEYLYQMQAEQNIQTFKSKGVQKILANCPHCYNTMKHEYSQFGGEFEVVHHSVLLSDLVAHGRLRPEAVDGLSDKVATYHDPCYVSRHNNILDEPRQVLAATGAQTVEMPRCKRGTFCCGAGGSHMWMEESRGERINDVRISEAVETGADIVAVACPFCMQMFESSVGAVPAAEERGVQILDLAELLEMSVAYGRPVSTDGQAPAGDGGEVVEPAAGHTPAV